MPKETIWSQDPHTAAKHDILRAYLNAWYAILGNRWGRIVFLDGFAGPGVYSEGQKGSPLIALESLLDHGHLNNMPNCEFVFLFNERDTDRYTSLCSEVERMKAERGTWPTNISVYPFNTTFGDLADQLIEQKQRSGAHMAPTFAFIDPFGYTDVSMEQIATLLTSPSSEVFIYVDTRSLNRFSTAGNVDHHFEKLYGTSEYRNAPPAGDPDRVPFLIRLFERQLADVGNFDHVQAFQMRNARNAVAYHLVYATRSLKGLDTMKQAMWKVDPTGAYEFADVLAGQEVLFGPEVNAAPLRAALMQRFAGRIVDIDKVRTFTIAETPYHSSHLKRLTLKPMEDEGLIRGHNRSRKGTYPEGTRIEFIPRG